MVKTTTPRKGVTDAQTIPTDSKIDIPLLLRETDEACGRKVGKVD